MEIDERLLQEIEAKTRKRLFRRINDSSLQTRLPSLANGGFHSTPVFLIDAGTAYNHASTVGFRTLSR
jgi:hypothetical protein